MASCNLSQSKSSFHLISPRFQPANIIFVLPSSAFYVTLHFHKYVSVKKIKYFSWQCPISVRHRVLAVCGWDTSDQQSAPPPQTEISFSQITSEWMVNTACLASPANRRSGLHVDVSSDKSLGRFVWSVRRPTLEYPGMHSM